MFGLPALYYIYFCAVSHHLSRPTINRNLCLMPLSRVSTNFPIPIGRALVMGCVILLPICYNPIQMYVSPARIYSIIFGLWVMMTVLSMNTAAEWGNRQYFIERISHLMMRLVCIVWMKKPTRMAGSKLQFCYCRIKTNT